MADLLAGSVFVCSTQTNPTAGDPLFFWVTLPLVGPLSCSLRPPIGILWVGLDPCQGRAYRARRVALTGIEPHPMHAREGEAGSWLSPTLGPYTNQLFTAIPPTDSATEPIFGSRSAPAGRGGNARSLLEGHRRRARRRGRKIAPEYAPVAGLV